MIKSQLDELLAQDLNHLPEKRIQEATKLIIQTLTNTLISGQRIEIRGFGSFTLHYRPARESFNPKTGKRSTTNEKYMPHFKPGKTLKQGIDDSKQQYPKIKDD